MAVELDPFTQIVNIAWEEKGQQFLYSGADGMFGSEDGASWKKADQAVPATSLAWIDNVWIASGPGGCWRSEDGAQTWQTVEAPAFFGVAAMKPKSLDPNKPRPGVLAGWIEDDAGDHHIVYTSHDLGKTWNVALTIPTSFGDSGSESIRALSGCGGALFVCTDYHSETFHSGDGKIYSSTDGHTFSPQTVFGPGSVVVPGDPFQYPRIGFAAQAAGYDPETKNYIAIGDKEIIPEFGVQESYLIYTLSASTSFRSGTGTVAESARQVSGRGDFISVALSAAGGDGKHVTGFSRVHNNGSFTSGELNARFIPGASSLLRAMGTHTGGYVGSFCFRSDAEANTEGSTDQPEGAGQFACVAFGSDKSGGAYIASSSGGGFTKTHSGTGIGSDGRGAVAVGTLGFLGEPDAGL
jgi:hypothetical protein